jgi:hypothetical protein
MASNDVSTEVAGAVVGSKRKAEEVVAEEEGHVAAGSRHASARRTRPKAASSSPWSPSYPRRVHARRR